ncbi:hypothetical protein KEM48_003637 [Puccinia striiformis f. sp. tritici PST-130]|nr:hypothetical protein KEM48_003637 [Puccinia striiformis f. sp. tritici PST-130]
MIATLATTPKLLLHVFIGARVFHLSDPSSTRHLDNLTIALNIFYIIGGARLDDEARIGTLPGGNRLRTLDEEEDEIRRELLGAEAADSERQWDVEFDDFDQDEEDDHTATLPDSKT